ncbi:MAG TPA: RNA polymerase factor sigma-54 [Rhizomicrobium sp.]|jgi:RNA polymerase sigma-54 factor|nr:RNA polymerase factor sigma-54 [Rhizomicrobium sp.]
MALTQRLEIRQGHALVMTPQLQQAIKLLQLSNLELCTYVEQELERNPLLERDEGDAAPAESGDIEAVPENNDEPLEAALARDDFSRAEELDAEREDVFAEDAAPPLPAASAEWTSLRTSSLASDDNHFERTLAAPATLQDYLVAQLAIAGLDAPGGLIGISLIDAIDEAGYLRIETDDIAARLGAEPAAVESILRVIQGFDPTGVGARNLSECLALQLREKGRLDPAMSTFLSHLDLVARRDIAGLGARCGVDAEDVAEMIAELRALTPKPGLAFGAEPVQPVVPDVFVREAPDGSWHVELNGETLPRLLVSARYYANVAARARDKESQTYLTECLNSANWLVKSLDQRARTILKVASEIVRQQDGFLTHGVRHLRPLNLRTIADAISMHESTVSRVTSNKYVSTPRGVFELKYFFTSAIQATNGAEAHSAEAVRDRIRNLIEKESAEQVLSDDRIVNILTGDGINIARRTVAKYREAMRIPSSVERRRMRQTEPRQALEHHAAPL